MSIATEHPEYLTYKTRWSRMEHALSDEDAVKAQRTRYLPKTGGMKKNDVDESQYNAYLMRARFPEVTQQGQSAIIGLVFEQDPEGMSDAIVTNTAQTNLQLSREMLRAVSAKGRDILVVDAPRAPQGGPAFISRYAAESLINWKLQDGNPSELNLAVFRESAAAPDQDEYGHETRTVYRKYQRTDSGPIEVSLWAVENERDVLLSAPMALPVSFMPIVIPGSIDLKPNCDPVPLLPIARCAFAYYLMSADRQHALYLTTQPTPWLMGVDEDLYEKIRAQGIGSSALWHLGENGAAGFLQVGADVSPLERAMMEEMKTAAGYAVRLTQDTGIPESGAALAMRAATQHASIYSMADSVSIAVTRAQQMRALWAGEPAPEDFVLSTKFTPEHAVEQMINSLNSAINGGNAPRSAMFSLLRRSGLTELDDVAIQREIDTQGLDGPGNDDDEDDAGEAGV